MSSSNDWGTLKEVVVGRADFKPVHLHDEPATRRNQMLPLLNPKKKM